MYRVAEQKIQIIVSIKWQNKLEHGATIVAITHSVKNIRPFNSCVCDVTIVLMVGGLGVADQHNDLRDFPFSQIFVLMQDTANLMIETKNT